MESGLFFSIIELMNPGIINKKENQIANITKKLANPFKRKVPIINPIKKKKSSINNISRRYPDKLKNSDDDKLIACCISINRTWMKNNTQNVSANNKNREMNVVKNISFGDFMLDSNLINSLF